MKTLFKSLIAISLLLIVSVSCSKDSDSSTSSGANNGTYEGNLQVTDDPQTNLGYVFNTNVTLTTNGTNATVKITGNEGFDREYIGTVNAGSTASNTIIGLTRQTKPVDKTAGGTLVIINNSLTIDVNLANDAVVVRKLTNSPTTLTITGKIGMIGTNLLKK
jgi:hypothetical protein